MEGKLLSGLVHLDAIEIIPTTVSGFSGGDTSTGFTEEVIVSGYLPSKKKAASCETAFEEQLLLVRD